MFTKKLLSGILSATMLISCISVSAAAVFSDVANDPTVAWAVPYITEMTEKGYIKGYEDGTFKPNNTISKTEALILLSRMLGVDDANFKDSVGYAVEKYADVLSNYSTPYTKEVSFLLYTGVLGELDLDLYISNSNKNAALKRYEAAILLTKLLGAEDEVSTNAFVSSSYADTVEIPDNARAYVEYVKEQGIMQGMGNNEDGAPMFSPNTAVTRSQMAKMLCTLIDVINLSSQSGTVSSVDTTNKTITVNINGADIQSKVADGTKIRINGADTTLAKIKVGMQVKITHITGELALIENTVLISDGTIYGLVSATRDNAGVRTVTLTDANDKNIKETYTLAKDAKIRVNSAIDLFSKVSKNDYVALQIENDLVVTLEVIDKTTTASGIIRAIDYNEELTKFTVADASGELITYEAAASGVKITRDGQAANTKDLLTGDTVSITLTYGKVTKIQATSSKKTGSGTIDYITHTLDGTTIGIKQGGDITEYKVHKTAKILIDSVDASIYDIRPGTDIDFSLQSYEITRIETASTIVESQFTGTVVTVNANYGLLIVETESGQHNVFISTLTKIIDSANNGAEVRLKSITKGRTVSITGSNTSGVLEASVIVLQ